MKLESLPYPLLAAFERWIRVHCGILSLNFLEALKAALAEGKKLDMESKHRDNERLSNRSLVCLRMPKRITVLVCSSRGPDQTPETYGAYTRSAGLMEEHT